MKLILVLLSFLLVSVISSDVYAQSVPDWVKNTAGWWATDAISETEFVNANLEGANLNCKNNSICINK